MQFNSDRTRFQENALTNSIRDTLEKLNKFIQTKGSDLKTMPREEQAKQAKPPPSQLGLFDQNEATNDPTPKDTDAEQGLRVEQPKSETTPPKVEDPLKGANVPSPLIANKGTKSFVVNFNINPITNLLDQLSKLYASKTSYDEVITCSLRALFELAIYELEMAEKINFIVPNGYNEDRLGGKVSSLISHTNAKGDLKRVVLAGLGRTDYQQFGNEISAIDFKLIIKKCHLGTHKSSQSLFDSDIREIGNAASWFLAITSELLNNTSIDWNSLGQPWEITLS